MSIRRSLGAPGAVLLACGFAVATGAFSTDGRIRAAVRPDKVHLPCTSQESPPNFTAYSLGEDFEGLPAVFADRVCYGPLPTELIQTNYTTFIYGDCESKPADADPAGCSPPLEVKSWPACERSSADYEIGPNIPYPHDKVEEILGVPAISFDGGTRLELYSGQSTIVIFANDPALPRRAALALRPLPDDAAPTLDEVRSDSRSRPTDRLPSPAPGLMTGTLECQT